MTANDAMIDTSQGAATAVVNGPAGRITLPLNNR